jgi:hypothetical protein
MECRYCENFEPDMIAGRGLVAEKESAHPACRRQTPCRQIFRPSVRSLDRNLDLRGAKTDPKQEQKEDRKRHPINISIEIVSFDFHPEKD